MYKNHGGKTTLTSCAIIVCVLIALMAGIYLFYQQHDQQKDLSTLNGTFLPVPRSIGQFELIDHHSKAFTNDNLLNQWSMLFFGFTNCPHVCPMTMAELNDMYRQLQQNSVSPLPQVVLVSIDPKRDSTEQLNNYVTSFNPNFVGVTGSPAELDRLSKELGIVYMKISNDDIDNYDIEHSGTIILFNPQGQLTGFFSLPHEGATLAKDIQLIVS